MLMDKRESRFDIKMRCERPASAAAPPDYRQAATNAIVPRYKANKPKPPRDDLRAAAGYRVSFYYRIEEDIAMKPWIKRTLFGMLGASLLVGSLPAPAATAGATVR